VGRTGKGNHRLAAGQLDSAESRKLGSWPGAGAPHTHKFAHLACKLVAGHEARQKASNWPTSVSV